MARRCKIAKEGDNVLNFTTRNTDGLYAVGVKGQMSKVRVAND